MMAMRDRREVEVLQEVGDVEIEWSKFKKSVVENAEKVCGIRKVRGQVRRSNKWWC